MNLLKNGLIASLALMGLSTVSSNVMAASVYDVSKYINIDINSGNPAFPFPQFLEYKEGKTLAKYNAEGVTHADMEKTMREAYQIMSHRCRYDGGTHCGVPYITFNNFRKFGDDELPMGGAEFCTEGDGYMLLASAIFADQATFNGLWMWIHDNRIPNVERYQDGEINFKDYEFGVGLPSCYANAEENSKTYDGSATDGDEDIALALVIAHKQWGDTMMQDGKPVKDFKGNTISYRKMAKDYLSAFVDTFMYTQTLLDGSIYMGGHMSGDIGIDGYVKGGNKGFELTNWRSTQTIYPDITQNSIISGGGGDGNSHTDYCAPSYYNEFAKWLEEDNKKNPDPSNEWRINQYKRAEASSDWLMGEAYKQGLYPSLGNTKIKNDTVVSFDRFSEGEDFRTSWRTVLNYLWHGNPATTWDPKAHQVKDGTNTFEKDMALRYAELMKNPKDRNGDVECGKLGVIPDPNSLSWFGPAQIKMCYNMDGTPMAHYNANYALGCSGPSVVALGDLELLGDIYRECELAWDDASAESEDLTDDDRYINSTPKYFHGWFRTLGMLVTSGNLAAPADMKPSANVKVYMSVDKTFAYKGDNVTYGVQCRNYGTADAKSAVITTQLDPNYEFVSATKGGVYNASSHSIIWKIGDIPGFRTGKLDATMDSVSFTVSVKDTLNRHVALTSTISGSNFDEWISNEYPNNATYTMERNLVDILDAPISLEKQVSATEVAVNDTVDFVINITPAKVNMLCGGRENVRWSYGNYLVDSYGPNYQYYRLFHDASEAYVNMGDYRVSYFLYDTCGVYSEGNRDGFKLTFDNQMDAKEYGSYEEGKSVEFEVEDLEPGEDENGKWNKRIITKFPNILSVTTSHLNKYLKNKFQIHKGVWGPLFYRTRYTQIWGGMSVMSFLDRRSEDWSFSKDVSIESLDGQSENYSLVSPGWYNEDNLGEDLTKYARHSCDEDVVGFDRVLVEQWDGYTWRRIQGTSPIKTNCYKKVVFTDTLPKGMKLIAGLEGTGASFDENTRVLKFEIPEISSEKVLQYRCVVEKDIETGDLKIGGANITAGDITAESNTVKLTVKEPTDVKNVNSFNQNELVDVYSTNGALLRKQVEFKDALIGLQSGVYMVNGVKIIVK